MKGRKIIVDTYGGYARYGGGAFPGKDPTKVDRSAAYMERYVAKNIVAAGIANKCKIQIANAIGVAQPVSIAIDIFNTGKYSNEEIFEAITELFDLRPGFYYKAVGAKKTYISEACGIWAGKIWGLSVKRPIELMILRNILMLNDGQAIFLAIRRDYR